MLMRRARSILMKPFKQEREGRTLASQLGMTIIEILLVIALLGTIMTLVVSNLVNVGDEARMDAVRLGMSQLDSTLQMYKIQNYRYPTTEQGLIALVEKPSGAKRWRGPYTDKAKLQDAWGNDYAYESDGKTFKIISPGVDGVVGNEDDLVYPEEEAGEP